MTSIKIADSVTSIGYNAFEYCTGLTSVTIPGSVTSIGEMVFAYCSGLTNVSICHGVTSIGVQWFCDCTGLTSVNIPDSVTSIGFAAFVGCSNLSDIYYSGSETDWGNINIEDYTYPLTNAELHCNYVAPNPKITETPVITKTADGYHAEVALENPAKSGKIIAVSYIDGMVAGVGVENLCPGDTEKTINIKSGTAKSIKVFIWDSFRGMKPLCEAAEVTIQ